ncbi:MAG: 4Fe-4S binding protein [Bacteroidota bacterium]|nr:4Fe-4S binding protein [Bacteroidota bacterium]
MRKYLTIFLFLIAVTYSGLVTGQQRFPKPEFSSGYVTPSPTTPEPRANLLEYADVVVLLVVLSVASWIAIRKRSRRAMLWLSVFSLLYFGFYREGCICPIGAIQNVTLTFADPLYAISISALLIFLIPLIFALFFGRTFCAAACPLGALQDLLIITPFSTPVWIRKTLSFIPYVYLALAVLYAATGTDFIICRYDPFVGFFRINATFNMFLIGACFLGLGLFFARPYCRIFCPYGALLNIMSRFSKWHLSITPAQCIQCKLCSTSCPFDAIEHPTEEQKSETTQGRNLRRFITFGLLIPVWILVGGYIGAQSHVFLSKANPQVHLTELLIAHPELKNDTGNIDIQTFLSSGKSFEQQVKEAQIIRHKFYIGGWFFGGFLGLVIGLMLMNQSVFRKRTDYQPHKGDCYSCGRCLKYCPVKKDGTVEEIA